MGIDLVPGFTLHARVGRGASGSVWKAQHIRSGTPVAIKFLEGTTPQLDALFQSEIRSLARLDHPHIVRIHDYGRLEAGERWLAVEWCERGALTEVKDWQTLEQLVTDVLHGLLHAHARGVLHRDVKPSNVLIDAEGRYLVADFGMASFQGSSPFARVGSPAFMAPEAVRGERAAQGPWTDLYSLAAMVWMLAGARPLVVGTVEQQLQAHLEGERPPFRPRFAVPDDLEAWLHRLLAWEPTQRTQHCVEALHTFPGHGRPSVRRLQPGRGVQFDDIGWALQVHRPTPFVGRDAELDGLLSVVEAWRQTGDPHILALEGPEGVGRTRLATELAMAAYERGLAEWRLFELPREAAALEAWCTHPGIAIVTFRDARRPKPGESRPSGGAPHDADVDERQQPPRDRPATAASLVDLVGTELLDNRGMLWIVPGSEERAQHRHVVPLLEEHTLTQMLLAWLPLDPQDAATIAVESGGLPGLVIEHARARLDFAIDVESELDTLEVLAWTEGLLALEDWESAHGEVGRRVPSMLLDHTLQRGVVIAAPRRDGRVGLRMREHERRAVRDRPVEHPRFAAALLARLSRAPECGDLFLALGRPSDAVQFRIDETLRLQDQSAVTLHHVGRAIAICEQFPGDVEPELLWSARGLALMAAGNENRPGRYPQLDSWIGAFDQDPYTGTGAARFAYGVGFIAARLMQPRRLAWAREMLERYGVGASLYPLWREHLIQLEGDDARVERMARKRLHEPGIDGVRAHLHLCISLSRQHRFPEVVRVANAGLARQGVPDRLVAQLVVLRAMARTHEPGQLERSIDEIWAIVRQQHVMQASMTPVVEHNLASLLCLAGRYDEAARFLRTSTSLAAPRMDLVPHNLLLNAAVQAGFEQWEMVRDTLREWKKHHDPTDVNQFSRLVDRIIDQAQSAPPSIREEILELQPFAYPRRGPR